MIRLGQVRELHVLPSVPDFEKFLHSLFLSHWMSNYKQHIQQWLAATGIFSFLVIYLLAMEHLIISWSQQSGIEGFFEVGRKTWTHIVHGSSSSTEATSDLIRLEYFLEMERLGLLSRHPLNEEVVDCTVLTSFNFDHQAIYVQQPLTLAFICILNKHNDVSMHATVFSQPDTKPELDEPVFGLAIPDSDQVLFPVLYMQHTSAGNYHIEVSLRKPVNAGYGSDETRIFKTMVAVRPLCSTYDAWNSPDDFYWRPTFQNLNASTLEWIRRIQPNVSTIANALPPGTYHNELCSDRRCLYADFEDDASRELLRDHTIYFMGNSHIRNLFRCVADSLSHGQSKLDPMRCQEGTKKGHCLACDNFTPIHRTDYTYQTPDIQLQMQDDWTVVWQESQQARMACNASFPATEAEQDCMAGHRDALHYKGNRTGLDHLLSDIFPKMLRNERAYLVMNIYLQHNTEAGIMEVVEAIKREPSIAGRTFLIVDPHAEHSFDHTIAMFNQAGITVLDLRHVYRSYEQALQSGALVEETDGKFHDGSHLNVALQRTLIQHLLTHIAHQSWLKQQPETRLPLPHLCSSMQKE